MRLRALLGKAVAAIALAAMPVQAMAQAQCLTHEEAEAVVTAFLPALVTGVSSQCRHVLPDDSALSVRGIATAQRYSAAAEEAREVATPIAARMILAGENPPGIEEFDPAFALDAFEVALTVELASTLDANGCTLANGIFEALEPLPARNFARLIVIFLDIGGRDDEAPGPFSLCRVEA